MAWMRNSNEGREFLPFFFQLSEVFYVYKNILKKSKMSLGTDSAERSSLKPKQNF